MALAAPFPAADLAPRGVRRRPADRSSHVRALAASPAASERPSRGASQGLVLTQRGRLALGALSVLFLLAVIMFSGRVVADASAAGAAAGPATAVVVVQQGETLWQIAKQVAPEADPRATVADIRELNGLGETAVVAGQQIQVPITR